MARRKYFVLSKRTAEDQEQGTAFWAKARAVAAQDKMIEAQYFSAHLYEMRWGQNGEWRPPIRVDQLHYDDPVQEGTYEDPHEL